MTTNLRFPVPPCVAPDAPSPFTATGAPLRWGVVATGRIAQKVTEDIARLEDAVLQAVSSRLEERARAFADTYGFATAHYDDGGARGFESLAQDPDVDVVYIATPHGQHYEVCKEMLSAGKHVLCEKAFTVNAREAEELINLAREKGVFLMEAVWTRFLPSVNRAWDIIHSGELGEIRWVQADLGFPAVYSREARLWDPLAGGGALLDLTVYPSTWALGALGFPTSVVAEGTLNDDGVDAQNALTLTYASGAHAQLSSSLLASGPSQATVAGTKGWLRTSAPLHNPRTLYVHPHGGEARVEEFDQAGNGYSYELRETTRCIQEGLTESPTMSLQHTLDTMRMFDGVRAQLGVRYANDDR